MAWRSGLLDEKLIDVGPQERLQIHMIPDNYGTHTHDNVVAWLDKHSWFHLHFIPTSSSRLNMVERWFREFTEKAIRRGPPRQKRSSSWFRSGISWTRPSATSRAED